jgi:hypothetical protein
MATLDYKLSADTLNRVGRAKSSGYAASGIGDTSGLEDGLETLVEEGEKKKEEEEKRVEETGLAEVHWATAFDKMAEDGGWANNQDTYTQFQELESGQRERYLAAVGSGNRVDQAKVLAEQVDRGKQMKAYAATMTSAAEIQNGTDDQPGVGWGVAITENDRSKFILNQMAAMDGSVKPSYVDGKLSFEIEVPDTAGWYKGDGPITVTQGELDELIAGGIAPVARTEAFTLGTGKNSLSRYSLKNMQDLGYDNDGPDAWGNPLISVAAEANNKRSISRDNVYSMARDVWAGDTSFLEDFEEFDLTQILAGADKAGKDLLDESVDGKLDGNTDPDLAKTYVRDFLIKGAKNGELDEEQFTLLQGLISEWMLMKQERNFKQGQAKKDKEINESLTRQGTSVSLAERNRREDRLSVDGAMGQ